MKSFVQTNPIPSAYSISEDRYVLYYSRFLKTQNIKDAKYCVSTMGIRPILHPSFFILHQKKPPSPPPSSSLLSQPLRQSLVHWKRK